MSRTRRPVALICAGALMCALTNADIAAAWDLPPDTGTIPAAEVEEILKGQDYPETSSFTQRLQYVDFEANGKTFTQVVVRLDPEKPLMHDGRKVVLVATEEGSSSINGFIKTDEDKDGIGVWMAKRGVTFIALNRIGRWNFNAPDRTGSWEAIPLDERMPIFSQHQDGYWSTEDWASEAAGKTSSSTGSKYIRFAKPGTELYDYIIAATPVVVVDGFETGLRHVMSVEERENSMLLYWGFSTGGAFMWPLAERIRPDGFLNWGSSPTGVGYFYGALTGDRWDWLYGTSALRVRGRGIEDFEFYNKNADPAEKETRWQRNLREPRFKGVEDSLMFFNVGALAEHAMRLYRSDFIPEEKRQRGYVAIFQEILDVAMPSHALEGIPIWDMNGTLDEVYPPEWMEAAREIEAPYTGRHRITRIEGLNHSIVNRQVRVIGPVWLRAIEEGFFD